MTDGWDGCQYESRRPAALTCWPRAFVIEPGNEGDLPAITGILNYTIMNSNATLATEPVTVDERREWFGRFSVTGPYRLLVARRGSQVLGYAASQPYREHEGFRETVEVSIALDFTSRGQGAGTALYRALLGYLAHEPVHIALAGIVLPNDASVALHRKLGFTEVGTFHEYAVKNGQYLKLRMDGTPLPAVTVIRLAVVTDRWRTSHLRIGCGVTTTHRWRFPAIAGGWLGSGVVQVAAGYAASRAVARDKPGATPVAIPRY